MENLIEKKQISAVICGGSQAYQNYRKVMELSPTIYEQDLSLYTDDVNDRHDRNLFELRKLINLIKNGTITPSMLLSNTWNTFYPSYVLHNHYTVFIGSLKQFSKNSTVQKILKQAQNLQIIGSFFDDIINAKTCTHNNNQNPTIQQNGSIKMDKDSYFYSQNTSLLINYCSFLADRKDGTYLCLIKLRDGGQINNKIHLKDFGATLSNDYHNIGYNFNQVHPQISIKLSNSTPKNLLLIKSQFNVDQFGLSLGDLKKALYLSFRYCSMRRQFATIQGSKQQRRIITYQGVAARILDGFTTLVSFSFLVRRLKEIPILAVHFVPLVKYSNHTILEKLIQLRQCCGGFGYLQASGHPGCIERTAYRAAWKQDVIIPDHKQFLKRAHYYSGDDALQHYFGQKIQVSKIFNFSQLFRVFILICIQMRKRQKQLTNPQYIRQFVKQAAIQAIYNFDSYGRVAQIDTISTIIQYVVADYIINNGKYINWSYLKIQPQQFFIGVHQYKRNLLIKLTEKFNQFQEMLEIDYVRNTVAGRQNQEDFYTELMNYSINNKKNSQQYQNFVKQPIIEMLVENRKAKL